MRNWTWEDCRAKYCYWGTMYEKLQEEFPKYKMTDEEQKVSQNFKILMTNMIDLVNLLEATPEFHNVNKRVGHTTLGLGFFEDESVTGCNIDWLIEIQKYQISFSNELSFVVSLEQVLPTIQRYINYQHETDNLDFPGLKNWSWQRCRHRFLTMRAGYIKSLTKHAHRDPEGYEKASKKYRVTIEKMIALIDLLEADPQLTNARKRIGHDWLFLRLENSTKNVGMSIEWINEIKKFRIKLGRQDNNTIFETNLDDAIPTIKQNIRHFQENEQEQDNNPE